ncbi:MULTISPECIES: DoxX family membrane protein [unclassified Arthrobacter]|uniref:DoxX family membrane protein n=1 Tax=unclassified Arthrobacter TaxID=235627 RepID=UPI00159DAE3F|nr:MULTISPECIES: DoxX family membrane protein [unclassified Arthrobacter]MCQ9162524.1 DoxX family membrane protein [Arthrobacter sp. STN4]NVM98317.1 DoxX family membrane protein [Arthrobacter sp. SDTb3-6]
MGFSISNAALRLVSGAFILNSGLGKLSLSPEHAAGLQASAARVIPQAATLEPEQFGRYLSFAEIGIGTTLLLPFVPSRLAGLVLAAFSTGLFANYLKSPGLTEADGIRPTPAGVALSKDIWLVGIATALVFHRRRR